jgi:hypothetical protein
VEEEGTVIGSALNRLAYDIIDRCEVIEGKREELFHVLYPPRGKRADDGGEVER